jgi:hypothetical protein
MDASLELTSAARIAQITMQRLAHPPFAPVPAESLEQLLDDLFYDIQTPADQLASFEFSPAFIERYGSAVFANYTDYHLFVTTPITTPLPNYRHTFRKFVERLGYTAFCKDLDDLAIQNGATVPGRRQMEAAYAQLLLSKFDQMLNDPQQMNDLLAEGWLLPSEPWKALQWLQNRLRDAMRQRLGAKAQNYWDGKAAKYPFLGLDTAVLDGSLEPKNESGRAERRKRKVSEDMEMSEGKEMDIEMSEGEEMERGGGVVEGVGRKEVVQDVESAEEREIREDMQKMELYY